jgi:GxxExxY protein
MLDIQRVNALTDETIGAAIRVHKRFGPGLLHSVYLPCLAQELLERNLSIEVEKPLALNYGTVKVDCAYRIDLVVEETVVVEVKCIDKLAPIHVAQMLTYLRLTGCPLGLLINFNVTKLTNGIRRVVNELRAEDGSLA